MSPSPGVPRTARVPGDDPWPSPRRAAAARAAVLGFVATFAAFLLGGCGWRGRAPRLVLIGLDGADWRDLAPLVDAGRVPNLRGLIARGTAAPLATLEPTKSPVIWTTIATGRRGEDHGITDFEWQDPATGETRLFTSNQRRVPAVWNLLSDAGIGVGVVGWWVTWPAEEVRGFLVSSYTYPKARLKKGTVLESFPGQVWPPELAPQLQDIVREGERRAREEVFPRLFPDLSRQAGIPWLTKIVLDSKWTGVSDEIFAAAAESFGRQVEPAFLTVYFGGIDVVGHRFLRFHRPDSFPPLDTPAALEDSLRDVIPATYARLDTLVGRMLDLADDDTAVLVVSDHGMDAERDSKPEYLESRSGQHRNAPPGVLIAAGGPFRRGGWREDLDAGVLDVLPTVLRALDLPVAGDLPGRVLEGIFDARFLEEHPPRRVPTFGTREVDVPERPLESPADEELRERLRALGYIR